MKKYAPLARSVLLSLTFLCLQFGLPIAADEPIFSLRTLSVTSPSGSCFRRQPGPERWLVEPGGTYTVTVRTAASPPPPTDCFATHPEAILVALTNFDNTPLLLQPVPNTNNQYRGTVTIPSSACGITRLVYVCDDGSQRSIAGSLGTNFVTFAVSTFPMGCSGDPVVPPANCAGARPTIVCPENIVAAADPGTCATQIIYPVPLATGNPTPSVRCLPDFSGNLFGVGVQSVECVASNIFGEARCRFTVTVIDDQPPTIHCADVCLASDDAGTCSAWSTYRLKPPEVSDNCGMAPGLGRTNTFKLVSDAPEMLPLGTTLVTWTATDTSGNQARCQQNVTVVSAVNVAFRRPLVDGLNEIRAGQLLPIKIELRDCTGQLITSGITAKLRVRGYEDIGYDSIVFDEVTERAHGLGISGSAESDGTFVMRGSHYLFNLDTGNFLDPNTLANPARYYDLNVVVTDDATGCVVAENISHLSLETTP